MRAKLEARIAAVATRLSQLAATERAREARRSELAKQVQQLRSMGVGEQQRRLVVEAHLRQAAQVFQQELAGKSDEVAALQIQLRCMRNELAGGPAAAAAAAAAAGVYCSVPLNAAAATGNITSPPMTGLGRCMSVTGLASPTHDAAATACQQQHCTPATTTGCCCGTTSCGSGGCHMTMHGSSSGGGGGCGGGCRGSSLQGAGADAVAAELCALRATRGGYEAALLQQQQVRNSLLSTFSECLNEVRPSLAVWHAPHQLSTWVHVYVGTLFLLQGFAISCLDD